MKKPASRLSSRSILRIALAIISWAIGLPASNASQLVSWGLVNLPYTDPNTTYTKIIAGTDFSAAIKSDGRPLFWGANWFGLIDGMPNLTNVAAIGIGYQRVIALKTDGNVVAWGNESQYVPSGLSGVVEVGTGWGYGVALKTNGLVVAWGGYNATPCTNIPPGLNGVAHISAGSQHVIALKSNGTVVAWGNISTNGLSGVSNVIAISAGSCNLALKSDGTVIDLGSPTEVIAGLSNVVAISSGGGGILSPSGQCLALKNDSTVFAWGGPVVVPVGLSNVVAISAGSFHSLALTADGKMVSLGGDAGKTVLPGSLTDIRTVAAKGFDNFVNNMAIRSDGTVVGWSGYVSGINSGLGDTIGVPLGLTNVIAVAPGNLHRLVLKADGTMAAWGGVWSNQQIPGQSEVINSVTNVVAIASGYDHSLALRDDGTVVAWGYNGFGQTNVPIGLSNVVAISSGIRYNFAVKNDGTVVGWGYDHNGSFSTNLVGLSNIISVADGFSSAIALRKDGTLVNLGIDTSLPAGLSNVVGLTVGWEQKIAIKADGSAVIWGTDVWGGLTNLPSGVSNFTQVSSYMSSNNGLVADTTNDFKARLTQSVFNRKKTVGHETSFHAWPTGLPPFRYQWKFNGENILGATNAGLKLSNLQTNASGVYAVIVSNNYGASTGDVAILTVSTPPAITVQLTNQTVTEGSTVTLNLGVSGVAPFTYQWWKDGVALPNATNAWLILSNVQPVNIGDYVAVVSNGGGSVTSSVASVSIPGVNSGLWQGLVAYYPFNGNANDESGFGNDGILHGPSLVSDRFGVHGSSYVFSGEGSPDNIEITKTNILDSDNYTVSLWFNAAAFPTDSPASYAMFLISRGRNDVELALGCPPFQSKGIRFLPRLLNPTTAQVVDVRTAVNYQTNFWYQLIATYDKEGSHSRLFLNGNQLEQTAYTGADGPPDIRSIKIGMRYNAVPGQGLPFKGSLDDVRIYNRALSSNEVAQLYELEAPISPSITTQPQSLTAAAGSFTNLSVSATGGGVLSYQWWKDGVALPEATNASLVLSNLQPVNIGDYLVVVWNGGGSVTSSVASVSIPGVNSGLWQGLVGYYPFNGNANDESGFGNVGLVEGASLITNRLGQLNAAYKFNTLGDKITTMSANGFPVGMDDCTVSMWVNVTWDSGTHQVLLCNSGLEQFQIHTGSFQNSETQIGAQAGGTGEGYYTPIIPWSLNQWYQIQVVRLNRTNVLIYRNGIQLSQQNSTVGNDAPTNQRNLIFGYRPYAPHPAQHYGGLDDIRIYNRALSSNDVAQLYALEFPDADKDGLSDYEEINILGTDPNKSDTDGDGLTDLQEVRFRNTNPTFADTDGDGFNDYAEIYTGHDPLVNADYPAANLSAFTAIELEFVTKAGTTYQLQTSPDLVTWTNFDNAIIGDGNVWKNTYPTRGQERLFHRVESVP